MATVAATTAGRVDIVEWPKPHEQLSAVAAADITANTFVRQDANGKWIVATAATAADAVGAYYAPRTVKSGEALTAVKECVIGGLTVPQAFNAPLYIGAAGELTDTAPIAAGNVTVQAGRVIPGTANQLGEPHDKLVRIALPN